MRDKDLEWGMKREEKQMPEVQGGEEGSPQTIQNCKFRRTDLADFKIGRFT